MDALVALDNMDTIEQGLLAHKHLGATTKFATYTGRIKRYIVNPQEFELDPILLYNIVEAYWKIM